MIQIYLAVAVTATLAGATLGVVANRRHWAGEWSWWSGLGIGLGIGTLWPMLVVNGCVAAVFIGVFRLFGYDLPNMRWVPRATPPMTNPYREATCPHCKKSLSGA